MEGIEAPSLAGRKARCSYYGGRKALGSYSSSSCKNGRDAPTCTCEEPSSTELAFFKFCGEGSFSAALCKHCGMAPVGHKPDAPCPQGSRRRPSNTRYEPQGDKGHDEFYCGCFGWD